MSPRQRIAALLLVTLATLSGARRLWPEGPGPQMTCSHPFGVRTGEALRVLCLEHASAAPGAILGALGLEPCGDGAAVPAGQMLSVEDGCPPTRSTLPAGVRLTLGLPVELNHASPADLEALPGVGPKLARRIILQRERAGRFGELGGLRAVRGIGPATVARLRPWLCIEGSSTEGCQR